MNVTEMCKWSGLEIVKDNATLVNMMTLIKEENRISKLTKVRAFLRGINDCCKIVMTNDKKSEQLNRTIEGYISELTKMGIVKGTEVKKLDEFKK